MKKLILSLALCLSLVGFAHGGPHHPHHAHHSHVHHVSNRTFKHVFGAAVVGSTIAHIINQPRYVWIPEQKIFIGYDQLNRPMYNIIPGHYELVR